VTRDDDRGTVTIDVEISEALAALIRREEGDDVDLGGWLADAGEFRLRQQYWHRDATLTVDDPRRSGRAGRTARRTLAGAARQDRRRRHPRGLARGFLRPRASVP